MRNEFLLSMNCVLRKFLLASSHDIRTRHSGTGPLRRRDLQKEQIRLDLALAAFELAKAKGLARVRVPQIAEAVGVSTRTFNNYFPSKEAAIVWPTTLRGARLASDLAGRPAGEPLADALVEVMAGLYGPAARKGCLRTGWTGSAPSWRPNRRCTGST